MADGFGDDDHEDGYDVTDPPLVRLAVLKLWLGSIALEAARHDHEPIRVRARIRDARRALDALRRERLRRRARLFVRLLSMWLDELADAAGVT